MKTIHLGRHAITLAGMLLLYSNAHADPFQAELLFDPVDIRKVETPASGVQSVVLSVLTATASSESTSEIDGGTGKLYGTSIAPTDATAHVFGYSSFRAGDGSELFLLFEGVPARATKDKVGRGTWAVVGANGVFEGAKGKGEYTFVVTDEGPRQTFRGDLTR